MRACGILDRAADQTLFWNNVAREAAKGGSTHTLTKVRREACGPAPYPSLMVLLVCLWPLLRCGRARQDGFFQVLLKGERSSAKVHEKSRFGLLDKVR